jgi:sugar phosphate permease
VDFIKSEGGPQVSSALAAFLSTPFDLCGAIGIVLMGWLFGRLNHSGRQRLLVVILSLLTVVLLVLPSLFSWGLWALGTGVGLVGFLVYGPYSLLAGVLAVEVRGKEYAATVSGLVDGAGYFAGVFSGILFGKVLMIGGYALGFKAMAVLTLISAVLCCFLYRKTALSEMPSELKSSKPAAV